MFVLSSPSGAGKSTLTRLIRSYDDNIELSVSVTTRPKRPSEVDGEHYHFISKEAFMALREADELLEWAQVHGNFYGTPQKSARVALEKGNDVIFDIDWQGTKQLYEKNGADIVSFFLLPPSMAELRSRLIRRAEDNEDVIRRRLENARSEIEHWREYDYVLINADVDETFHTIGSIIKSERLRRQRQKGLGVFVQALLGESL